MAPIHSYWPPICVAPLTKNVSNVDMFKKFEKLLSTDRKEAESVNLNSIESNVYTLFALQQLLRSHAYEQNLVTKNKVNISNQEIEDLMQAFKDNNSVKIKELYQKMGNNLS